MGADPLTMMLIASAVGSVAQGIGAGKAGKANRGIHNYNASVIRVQKQNELKRAAYEADLLRDKGKSVLASNRTQISKSGIEIAGSPLQVLGDNAASIEFDALMKYYGGELNAYELENQARNQEYMGEMAAWRGKQQKNAAFAGAAVSLMGAGFAQYASAASTVTAPSAGAGAGFGSGSSTFGMNVTNSFGAAPPGVGLGPGYNYVSPGIIGI